MFQVQLFIWHLMYPSWTGPGSSLGLQSFMINSCIWSDIQYSKSNIAYNISRRDLQESCMHNFHLYSKCLQVIISQSLKWAKRESFWNDRAFTMVWKSNKSKVQTYLQPQLQQWGAGNVYLLVLSNWKVNIVIMGLQIRSGQGSAWQKSLPWQVHHKTCQLGP